MANFGLFGFFNNYSRPGPGVSKDEPQKPPYIRYFQLMGRKYSKLIQLNLLFLVPFLIVVFLMGVIFFLSPFHYQLYIPIQSNVLRLDVWALYVVPIPLILLSPFVAGLTYVTRNFAREEHAFVFSDFKDAIKNNWKPFLLNGIFLYFAYMVLSFSMFYYYNQSVTNWIFILPFSLCLLLMVVLLFCQYYIPIMIVTFDLSLRKIYRNALIFSVAGLWRNFLLTAIFVFMLFLFYQALASVLGLTILIFFLALFCFSFVSYTTSFIVYPLIEKLLIKPYYEQQEQAKSANAESEKKEEETDEDLHKGEMDEDDAPEYVYINGRLIKRSELNDDQLFEDKHY